MQELRFELITKWTKHVRKKKEVKIIKRNICQNLSSGGQVCIENSFLLRKDAFSFSGNKFKILFEITFEENKNNFLRTGNRLANINIFWSKCHIQ